MKIFASNLVCGQILAIRRLLLLNIRLLVKFKIAATAILNLEFCVKFGVQAVIGQQLLWRNISQF